MHSRRLLSTARHKNTAQCVFCVSHACASPTSFSKRTIAQFTFSKEYEKQILQQLESKLQISQEKDWYPISRKKLLAAAREIDLESKMITMLQRYKQSVYKMLQSHYPRFSWNPLLFSSIPQHTLSKPQIQKDICVVLEKELRVLQPTDWLQPTIGYSEALQAAAKHGLRSALSSVVRLYHNHSFASYIESIYPELATSSLQLQRRRMKHGQLNDRQLHKQIFLSLEEELKHRLSVTGVSSVDQPIWYQVSRQEIDDALEKLNLKKVYQSVVSHYYQNNLTHALVELFPEYQLRPFLFTKLRMPRGAPLLPSTQLTEMVHFIENKLSIDKMSDWHRVSNTQLQQLSMLSLIRRHGGMPTILQWVYPNIDWDKLFSVHQNGKKARQRWLYVTLRQHLYPTCHVEEEAIYHENLKFENTGEIMVFDVVIRQLKMVFEYHGEHHYRDLKPFGPYKEYEIRDREKATRCREAGITMIQIPYTWNGTALQLQEWIQLQLQPTMTTTLQRPQYATAP